MTDGDKRSLIINERWNYKVKMVCYIADTRPLEKLLNEYNNDLEVIAKEEGFNTDPKADLDLDDIIGKKVTKL